MYSRFVKFYFLLSFTIFTIITITPNLTISPNLYFLVAQSATVTLSHCKVKPHTYVLRLAPFVRAPRNYTTVSEPENASGSNPHDVKTTMSGVDGKCNVIK